MTERVEVTYEVSVELFLADEGSPIPTEDDIAMGVRYQLEPTFDVGAVTVVRQ